MKNSWIMLPVAIALIVNVLIVSCKSPKEKPASEAAYQPALAVEKEKGGQDSTHLSRDVWYKNSLIYTVDIKMFKDSDGDGIGDIKGMIKQLDYIKSLGADIIWLPPFQPTTDLDDGYDITDYYKVDPRVGTMADFKTLTREAEKRGMHIIMDLVLNHTSINHPWFVQSRKSSSGYRGWYVWSPQKPKGNDNDLVFKGYQKDLWTFDTLANEYFYHRFYNFEPDLNTQNPEVKNEMWHIMNFWLATGITGFRIDAVTYLTEIAQAAGNKFKHDFTLLKKMRDITDSVHAGNMLLGEANVPAGESGDFFGKHGEALNTIFNFYVDQRTFYALATEDTKSLKETLEASQNIPLQSAWVYFLRNQDEMGMGRFSKEEKNKVYQAFAPSKNMQLYDRGIRRRLAPMLSNNLQQLKMAYSFLFSLQGIPMIRYGDEIGMGDDLGLRERLAVRTPMQWNNSANAGFSTNAKTLRQVINDGIFSYKTINVAQSEKDSSSLLHCIIKLAAVRKLYPAIALGKWKIIDVGSNAVIAASYEWNGKTIITLHNFSKLPQSIKLATGNKSESLQDLMNPSDKISSAKNQYNLLLEGYGYKWYIKN